MMCSNHQLQFTSLSNKYDELKSEHDDLKSEHADLKSEHADLKSKYADLNSKYTNVQEDNQKLNARIESLENENCKLLKDNISLGKMLDNAIISQNEKENELMRLRFEYDNVCRENADLREARSGENIRISVDNNAAVASDTAMHNLEEIALKDHKLPSEPVASYETVGNSSDNPIAEEINSINSTRDNSGTHLSCCLCS